VLIIRTRGVFQLPVVDCQLSIATLFPLAVVAVLGAPNREIRNCQWQSAILKMCYFFSDFI
jgi:hypothetical protein